MDDHQKFQARKRIKELDNRDAEKFKKDEAKNNFESIMYNFRNWLQEEENMPFVGEEQQEKILAEINEHLEWLDYGDGDNAPTEEYIKRYNSVKKE